MLLLYVLVALVGLAIGSFLNVVVWRVPRGESVVHPPSACPRCGNAIRNRDNLPVLGWLLLRGRCRDCAEPISVRYPLVEALCAVLFVVMAVRFGLDAVLPAYLVLAAVGLALALIDLDIYKLPDALTVPLYPAVGGLLVLAAAVHHDGSQVVRVLAGGLAFYGAYWLTRFAYPKGMGGGDVTLSGVLGMALGYVGWEAVFAGFFLGFLLGGLYSIVLVVLRDATRKSKVPFGPFMLLGTLVALLVGQDLVNGYLHLTVR